MERKPKAAGARQQSRKTRLSSVANSLRLLKAFSDDDYEIGISALAQRLGLAKSTVHRLASTLIHADMLEQNPENGRYRLGLALLELGLLVRRKMDVTNEARPYLRMLRETTGETVHLAILDHTSVLYVNKLESKQAIRMSSEVGSRAPVHCTGDGKALLAFQPDEVIDELIGHGLSARTANTITNPAALRRDLAAIRTRGYAVDDEESELGLRSVAAPIRSHSNRVVASLSIAGPAHRISRKTLLSHARELVGAADAISQRLGYRPGRARAGIVAGRNASQPIK
jgi:IclR family transcriptional regulator, KDG regulon repressor